jgi:hypothetical protein
MISEEKTTKHLNNIQKTYMLNVEKLAYVLDVVRLKLLRAKQSVLYARAKIMLFTEKELKIGKI